MSALPKAVKKQIEEANRVAEQMSQPPPPRSPETPPPTDDQGQGSPTAGGEAPPPPPAPAPEGWEQKYRVLQGKYNAEVPRLQKMANEQSTAIDQLQKQLTATQMMLASLNQPKAASGQAAPVAGTKLVKDEEIQEFGSDLYDFIRRTAQEAVGPDLDAKLRPVQQQVEEARSAASEVARERALTKRDKVFAALERAVPNWQAVNTDEGFLAWLDQADPYSGFRRGDLLKQAFERHDAPRVVMFFEGYRAENAAVTPPSPTAGAPDSGSRQRLDELVAPGTVRAGSAGAPNEAGKRVWTQKEVAAFYHDVTTGKFRTRADEKARLEADIIAAGREGRIR
jgi:hypothetical protein